MFKVKESKQTYLDFSKAFGKVNHSTVWLNSERNLHFAKGMRKKGLSTKGRYLWGPISEFSYKRVPYSMI